MTFWGPFDLEFDSNFWLRDCLPIFTLNKDTITSLRHRFHIKIKNIGTILIQVNSDGFTTPHFLFFFIKQIYFPFNFDYNLFGVGLNWKLKNVILIIAKLNVFVVECIFQSNIVYEGCCDHYFF